MAKISLDDDSYNQKMKQASDSGDKLGKSSEGLKGKLSSLKGIIVGVATGAVAMFVKNTVMAASEVEEMSSKFTAVFGDMEKEADAWAKSYSDAIGRNKNDIKGMIANQSDLMMGFGMTGDAALDLSQKMTSLAFDLGSFNNVADDEAVLKLQKSIMGLETSGALESLGVDLTETTMKTSEFTKATGKTWDELSRTEKMQVRYQEAVKQSERAIGDAERTAGGFANSTKALESKMKEFSQTIGAFFLPFATKGVNMLKDWVNVAIDFATKIGEVIASFKEGMENGESIVDNIWFVFQDVFGVQIPDSVLNMISSVIEYWQTLWDIVVEVWDIVGKPIFDGIVVIWETLKENSDSIFNAISGYFQIMTDAIKVVWESILKPVFEFIMDIAKQLGEKFGEHFGEMKRVFQEVLTTMKDIWEGVLKPCLQAIGDYIQNVLLPAWKFVFENVILPVVDNVFKGIINLWDNSLKPLFDAIIQFVQGVFSGNWSQAWEGIKNIIKSIWEGIKTIVDTILKTILDIAKNIFNNMKSAISDKMNNIKDTIKNIWNNVLDFLRGINLFDIGKNIIQGMINGIKNMATKVVDSVKSVVNGAIDGAKKLLGIHSPSRVFMEIGQYTGEGMAVGLENTEEIVSKASNRMINATIPTELPSVEAKVSKSNGGVPVILNIDGREFMRVIAPYKDELDDYDTRYSFA